jgi:excisionase family DNA binding protein
VLSSPEGFHVSTEIDDYVTKLDLKRTLSVSMPTVRKLLERGEFPGAFKLSDGPGAQWRIPKTDIEAFIERRRAASKPTRAGGAA